jgi:hypothetical protein
MTAARTKTGNGNAAAWRVYATTCINEPEQKFIVDKDEKAGEMHLKVTAASQALGSSTS